MLMKKRNPNTDSANNYQTESFTTFHKLINQSFLFLLPSSWVWSWSWISCGFSQCNKYPTYKWILFWEHIHRSRNKNKIQLFAAYKRLTSALRTHNRLKVKKCKKIFHANRNQKKVEVVILVSNKINFKPKVITRDEGSHDA